MKIYFAGSIRGGRENQHIHLQLIDVLREFGEVLTEHIGDKELSDEGEGWDAQMIFQRDVDWIREADILVAEVSTPSLGVGYELGFAEGLDKSILCLCQKDLEKKLSAMITGNKHARTEYYKDIEEAKSIINDFIKKL